MGASRQIEVQCGVRKVPKGAKTDECNADKRETYVDAELPIGARAACKHPSYGAIASNHPDVPARCGFI